MWLQQKSTRCFLSPPAGSGGGRRMREMRGEFQDNHEQGPAFSAENLFIGAQTTRQVLFRDRKKNYWNRAENGSKRCNIKKTFIKELYSLLFVET